MAPVSMVAVRVPASATLPPATLSVGQSIRERLRETRVDLEVSGAIASAPFAGGDALAAGLTVRAGAMVGPVGIALGAGGFSEARIAVQGGVARVSRFPVDLDIRLAWRSGRIED